VSESPSEQPIELRLRPAQGPRAESEGALSGQTLTGYAMRIARENALATITVGIPFFLSLFYYVLIASSVYVSEAHFIVRSKSTSSALGSIADNSALQPLSSMSGSNDDTQQVNDFLSSRDAMDRLIKEAGFLDLLSRPEADFLSRFPRFWSRRTREALYERFDEFLQPSLDTSSGISTLYAYAFRPEDARQLARAALTYGEELVNRLNQRARTDSLAFAKDMLSRAETNVKAAQRALADFRNREALFDPKRQGVAVIELIGKLNGDIAQLKTELSEVSANSPGSPKITGIKARIGALEKQVEEQRLSIAGGEGSLSSKLAEYEKLSMEQEIAAKMFSSSLLSLEGAMKDAQEQRLYLERVVEPNLPDYPLYPKRMRAILSVLAFSLSIYWILKVLGTIIWEHDP
jgi:capsular polysaccharide transport system permease protein